MNGGVKHDLGPSSGGIDFEDRERGRVAADFPGGTADEGGVGRSEFAGDADDGNVREVRLSGRPHSRRQERQEREGYNTELHYTLIIREPPAARYLALNQPAMLSGVRGL